jgi:hypothetical protein
MTGKNLEAQTLAHNGQVFAGRQAWRLGRFRKVTVEAGDDDAGAVLAEEGRPS